MAYETERTRPWHALKWMELGDARVTLGGDLRLRSEMIDAPMFKADGARPDSYLLRRVMVHAGVRFGPALRAFGQLSHHRAFGRKLPFPLDRNGLEIQQAFLEWHQKSSASSLGVRLGRQEIILSPRFMHPREATNIRSAYDGVRAWVERGPWRLEGFATRPIQNRPGTFDDRGNPAERLDGIRLTRSFGTKATLRITTSWHHHQREEYRLGAASGSDDRTSWGLRVAGRHGPIDLDAEHYFQTGRFAGQQIRAFGGAGELGLLPGGTLRPRAGARWLYGSGDKKPGDGTSGTFAGPFPRPPCCNDPLWLAPSNLAVLTPFVQITPHRNLMLETKFDFVRRLNVSDAIYAFPQVAYSGTSGLHGNDLGMAAGVSLTWMPIPEVNVGLQHLEQDAKGALAKAEGRGGRYTVASMAFRF